MEFHVLEWFLHFFGYIFIVDSTNLKLLWRKSAELSASVLVVHIF